MRVPFSAEELRDVRGILVGNAVTSVDEFTADLRVAGFIDIRATDLTNETRPFVAARLTAWRDNSARYDVITATAYAVLETFYATVARLVGNGSLGCVRLVARAT